jgi:hypothetical protein
MPRGGRERLDHGELPGTRGDGGITKHRYSCHRRYDLFEELQPFCGEGIFEDRKAGRVAARLRQTIDIASPDRIGDTGEHNRYGACRFQQRSNGDA